MSERARIIAWWGYVLCVIAIFEAVFLTAGFPYAVGAALLSIAILGVLLKLIVARLARRGAGSQSSQRHPESVDSPPELRP
jgi:hypothetical protein